MANMHTPLLPCPFCGGEAKDGYHEAYSTDSSFHWVGCAACEATIPYHSERERSSAVEVWNRRAPSQDAETVKALEEQVAYWKGASDRMSARNHELNEQVAKFGDRLSLRDTFITEKGLWHEFATTVLPSAQKESSHV